jgi:hypothetical protein
VEIKNTKFTEGSTMKKSIVLFSLLSVFIDLRADESINLFEIYDELHHKSRKMLIDGIDTNKKNDFLKEFSSDYNVLNSTDFFGDCGTLNLKKSCYLFIYSHEQTFFDESYGCLIIYARPVFKPKEYLIQETVIFNKIENEWKILGDRIIGIPLNEYAYSSLKGLKPIDMFPNVCQQLNTLNK